MSLAHKQNHIDHAEPWNPLWFAAGDFSTIDLQECYQNMSPWVFQPVFHACSPTTEDTWPMRAPAGATNATKAANTKTICETWTHDHDCRAHRQKTCPSNHPQQCGQCPTNLPSLTAKLKPQSCHQWVLFNSAGHRISMWRAESTTCISEGGMIGASLE